MVNDEDVAGRKVDLIYYQITHTVYKALSQK